MTPTVSIVVPAHNGMPWIKDAIDSVVAQSFADWEIVVRDDGSTDGTREWLTSLSDKRIRVEFADAAGAAANWTEVSRLAQGRLVKILCQDDLVLPGCLAEQVAAFDANPSAVMVASRHTVVDADGKTVIARHGLSNLLGLLPGRTALTRSVATGANQFGEPVSVMFRRDALQASLPFDPDFPYLTDLDMYRKVLSHGDFVGLLEVHAVFRISRNSWSQVLANVQSSEFVRWIRRGNAANEFDLNPVSTLVAISLVNARAFARRIVVGLANRKTR